MLHFGVLNDLWFRAARALDHAAAHPCVVAAATPAVELGVVTLAASVLVTSQCLLSAAGIRASLTLSLHEETLTADILRAMSWIWLHSSLAA